MQNLNNGEVYRSYRLADVISMVKKRKRWAGHVACVGERRDFHTKFYVGNVEGREHQEQLWVGQE